MRRIGAERWVGVDLDNTICLLWTAMRREIRKVHGIDIPADLDFNAYQQWRDHGVSDAQLEEVFRRGDVFRRMGIRSGARVALDDLRRAGYRIAVVTDRFWYDTIGFESAAWLHAHDIAFDELALVRAAEKADWVRGTPGRRFDLFFEDRLDTALDLAAVVPEVYLFDYAWNRTDEALPDNVYRISSWSAWRRGWTGWRFTQPDPSETRPFVVALVGGQGSGKRVAARLLEERGFRTYRYADILRTEAARRGIDGEDPAALQDLGDALRAQFGARILSKVLTHTIALDAPPSALLSGVHHPGELMALRADPRVDCLVIALEAPAEVRYARVRERDGAAAPSWDEFRAVDERDMGDGQLTSTRLQLGLAMDQADAVIDNSGSRADLERTLDDLLARHLPGARRPRQPRPSPD